MRGTWNGGGGEESLEIIGTGAERHSLRGESGMQKNGTKRKRKRANVA